MRPLYDLTVSTVLSAPVLFADDTTLPVLDPGRGRTKTGRLWCYAVDPRTWKGPGHPAAAYIYSQNRKGEHPAEHLAGFHGKLQVDGYTGFSALAKRRNGTIELIFCWAHCRRRFYEFHAATKSPLAAEALAQIATALRDRGRDPRPAARAPPRDSPAAQPSDRRGTADLAESHTGARVEHLAAGGRHRLHAAALVWPGAVPR